jgi:AraC family transcriptional regulator, exoenzyme S synthesis regulatory protein ExsA
MKDSVLQLPGDILPNGNNISDEIIIYNYTADTELYKGRCVLNKNAFSLVVSGEKTMRFAEKKVFVNDNEIHLLSAGNCIASIDFSKQKEFKSILLFFDENRITSFYVKYDKLINQLKLKINTSAEPYSSFRKDEFIENYISSLKSILKNKMSASMKQLKFEELMLYLLEKYPKEILSFMTVKKIDFDDINFRKIIETNITSSLTLTDLAFLCNISLSTFKRRFIKIYGIAPQRWILRRRMEIAADLLKNRNEKPGEVFYKVGYENHSSFTQSFKQSFGMTPKEYQIKNLAF